MIFEYASEPFRFEVITHPNKMVRMFFYMHNEQQYCRLEKANMLLSFLTNDDDGIIFKGRLRIEKIGQRIVVHGHKVSFTMMSKQPLIKALQKHQATF